MASNDIYHACARRVTEHYIACKSITEDIQNIHQQISGRSGPEKQNLEARLKLGSKQRRMYQTTGHFNCMNLHQHNAATDKGNQSAQVCIYASARVSSSAFVD